MVHQAAYGWSLDESTPIEVLRTQATVESEVSDTSPEPRGQPTIGSHAREPSENHPGAAAYAHVRQK